MHRLSILPSRGAWLALALVLGGARAASGAADFYVTPPVVIAQPGQVVSIPIEMSQALDTLGVLAINYVLPIDPAFVSNVTLQPEGAVWAWGTPFTNVSSTFVAVAATGGAPIASTTTRFHTLQFTVNPGAPVDQAMPIAFSVLNINEGIPVAQPNLGLLIVRTGTVGVGNAGAAGLGLEIAPNPVRAATRMTCRLPAGASTGRVALEVFSPDGRRLRVLHEADAAPGAREVRWDGCDAAGRRLPPGLYLARLAAGAGVVVRRFAILE